MAGASMTGTATLTLVVVFDAWVGWRPSVSSRQHGGEDGDDDDDGGDRPATEEEPLPAALLQLLLAELFHTVPVGPLLDAFIRRHGGAA